MANVTETKTFDAQGLKCPMPIVKAKQALDTLNPGEILKVVATDKGSVLDFQGWARTAKTAKLLEQETVSDGGRELYVHYIERI